MKILIPLSLITLIAGCASQPLTQEERSVRILRKSDAPADCREVGRVKVSSLQAITDEGKDDYLKREAFKIGGNTVAITRKETNDFKLWTGLAFKCPPIK